jgi:hypothetical protein
MPKIDLSWIREYLWHVCGVRRDLVVPSARLVYDLGLSYLDAAELIDEMEGVPGVAIAAKDEGCFLYGYGAARRGAGSPFDPDSPAMRDVVWAPGYDEDTDEGVEIDGVVHR